jgi:Tlde1 domain
MSYATAAYPDVAAFDGRAFSFADLRKGLRALADGLSLGLGAVAAAGLLVIIVTVAAAWIVNTALAVNPHIQARAPIGPRALALVQYQPPLDRAPTLSFAARWARATASMQASVQPANPQHPIQRAANVPMPLPRPLMVPHVRPKREIAAVPHLMQVAKLTPPAALAPARLSAPAPQRIPDHASSIPLPEPRPVPTPAVQAKHDIARPPVARPVPAVARSAAPVDRPAPKVAAAAPPPVPRTPAVAIAAPPPPAPRAHEPAPLQQAYNNSASPLTSDRHTAVYDITAHTVFLPNGERLEAHSGLGRGFDDPRYVSLRKRGPTPPNIYDLTLREELFHGVRAIRLNPEDDNKMFGRDGMLAHTYMLGRSGASFGCVSFKDYPKFLHAFLSGEVDRLVVVAHLDGPPSRVASARRDPDRYAFNSR